MHPGEAKSGDWKKTTKNLNAAKPQDLRGKATPKEEGACKSGMNG